MRETMKQIVHLLIAILIIISSTACWEFPTSFLGDMSWSHESEEENTSIYLFITGTTLDKEDMPLPFSDVELYHHNYLNGDTLKIRSDSEGSFTFGALLCKWKMGNVESLREVQIRSVNQSDSLTYIAEPREVECKSERQHITLILNEKGDTEPDK
jgi:hypothetical protein